MVIPVLTEVKVKILKYFQMNMKELILVLSLK
jgi:hypothetical protein